MPKHTYDLNSVPKKTETQQPTTESASQSGERAKQKKHTQETMSYSSLRVNVSIVKELYASRVSMAYIH